MSAIAVTGLGMVSSLGHDVVTSCAAARAGLSRAAELDTFSVYSEEEWAEVPVVGHRVAGFADGFEGIGKLVRLTSGALADLLEYAGLRDAKFGRTGFYLNLSSGFVRQKHAERRRAEEEDGAGEPAGEPDVVREFCRGALIDRATDLNGIRVPRARQFVHFGDHAGIVTLLWDAAQRLRSGELERCIVGGVDSRVEGEFLEAAVALGLVKTPENQHGFIPGEAAAFLALEPLDRALARGARVEAVLEAPAAANEPQHRLWGDPSVGLALSHSIVATLGALPERGEGTGLLVGDLTGDPHRAAEWGYALVRVLHHFPALQDPAQWYPAISFGDTGAAAGAVGACMTVRGFARGYAGTDRALHWLSSEDGSKGSFYLRNHRRQ